MKKVLALMLAMVLVLSLAACGGGSSSGGGEDTTSSSKDSVVGKWKLSSSVFSNVKSHNAKCEHPEQIKEGDDTAEFFDDGSCDIKLFVCYSVDGDNFTYVGNYSSYYTKQNGSLYLSTFGDKYADYKYTINNNQLIITIEDYLSQSGYRQEISTLTYDRID